NIMKLLTSAIAIVALTGFSWMAVAQQEDGQQCQQCPASQATSVAVQDGEGCQQCPASAAAGCANCPSATVATSATQEECAECPVSQAMAALPKMTYRIGEESTCCGESAAAMASESGAPIHFVVAENVYESKEEAYTALVTSTEEMVNAFVTPATCETSGCTTIAGKSCGCAVEAQNRTELVNTAVNAIQMTYTVGGEEACCPGSASALAETSGEPIHYVVNGEETACEMSARLALAHARYKAAVQATLAQSAPAAEAVGSGS
ncbi:MAG: hypothetical protein AAF456_20100, partial [Planctomycetota bacterium]